MIEGRREPVFIAARVPVTAELLRDVPKFDLGRAFSEYLNPQRTRDPFARVRWNELVAPRLTRRFEQVREARERIAAAIDVLRHGAPDEDWD